MPNCVLHARFGRQWFLAASDEVWLPTVDDVVLERLKEFDERHNVRCGKGWRLGRLMYTRKSLFRDVHSDEGALWYPLDALHELGVRAQWWWSGRG